MRVVPVFTARPDLGGELQLARGRVAIQDRFARPAPRVQAGEHTAHGRRTIYTTGGTGRAVVALDAVTGALKWTHKEDEGPRGAAAPRQLSGRGLAYWTDGREERILYVTPGYRLLALDAKTGNLVSSFGTSGAVDLKTDIDQEILPDLTTGEIGYQGAPVVGRDVVVIGAAFREGTAPKSFKNNKGYIRGFDVRTGKRLWTFHTIPKKGEPGYETWLNGSAEAAGNTGVWSQVTIDEDLGLVYLPSNRRPATTTAATVPATISTAKSGLPRSQDGREEVALPARTPSDLGLRHPRRADSRDITVDGRAIKAVAVPTKQGILYVFDRVTGKPVWPIEEKPVEKGRCRANGIRQLSRCRPSPPRTRRTALRSTI
jgi:quinoprotein glucose dehydrogenase